MSSSSEVKYVVDPKGKKIAAIIPIRRYQEILRDLDILEEWEDRALVKAMEESKNSPTVSYEEVKRTLARDS